MAAGPRLPYNVRFRGDELAVFAYGVAKTGRENLHREELLTFRLLAGRFLALDRAGLAAADEVR